ncbi:MAG: protein-glutamate O-methyltransferase CheR [Phenylobacterium sp.]
MTPRDGELIARLCAQRAGLRVDPEKAYLIESRLAPVARREGFASVGELLQAVRGRDEARLIWAAVEAMILPETWFFRDAPVFHGLRDEILPALAQRRRGQPIRIWSAACGSGQEVYSLALMLADAPLVTQVELFASDLCERLLEKARNGLYSQFEVQRGLPARLLVRHFERRDEAFVLTPRVRQSVRWRRVNLIEDLAKLGTFDVILCRNVMRALIPAARNRVMESLSAALQPDGCLVLGADEQAGAGMQPMAGVPGVFAPEAGARAAAA